MKKAAYVVFVLFIIMFLFQLNAIGASDPFAKASEELESISTQMKTQLGGAVLLLVAVFAFVAGMAGYWKKEVLMRIAIFAFCLGSVTEIVSLFAF